MDALVAAFFVVIGLAFCFRAKQWGARAARRVIAYDAIWFYQLFYFVGGCVFVIIGVFMLVQWAHPFL